MNMNRRKIFDSEYYSLPPIEKLNINVKEDVKLEKFGVVDSHIEFIGKFIITDFTANNSTINLVKIKPMQGVLHLGYETILFDAERNPMGEIFEIFGTVTDTYYALRFNSSEEAADKMPIGKEVFYAPEESVTKPVFPQELARSFIHQAFNLTIKKLIFKTEKLGPLLPKFRRCRRIKFRTGIQ
jgi:hypothetical protein